MSKAKKATSGRGRPEGTTKENTKDAVVRFRTHMKSKTRWVKTAHKQGKKLTEWIEETLDAAS